MHLTILLPLPSYLSSSNYTPLTETGHARALHRSSFANPLPFVAAKLSTEPDPLPAIISRSKSDLPGPINVRPATHVH